MRRTKRATFSANDDDDDAGSSSHPREAPRSHSKLGRGRGVVEATEYAGTRSATLNLTDKMRQCFTAFYNFHQLLSMLATKTACCKLIATPLDMIPFTVCLVRLMFTKTNLKKNARYSIKLILAMQLAD